MFCLKVFLSFAILVASASAITWYPTSEDLWWSGEAQKFFRTYFRDCPYTREEQDAVKALTRRVGYSDDKRCDAAPGVNMENCCTPETPCTLGGGYCSSDSDCKEDLVCGPKRCKGWVVSNIWRAGDNFDDSRDCCTYDAQTWEILSSGGAITEEHQAKCIPEGVEIPQVILDWEQNWMEYQAYDETNEVGL